MCITPPVSRPRQRDHFFGLKGDKPDLVGLAIYDSIVPEKQLWTVTCQRCHDMQPGASDGLPGVPETKIVRRWFTKAEFNHSAHQELQCVSCHPNAATSVKASDILLPGRALCAECHGAGVGNAAADCSTCHLYHDWNKARPVDGQFNIRQLTTFDVRRGSGALLSMNSGGDLKR